jgi:hypothetical protein
MNILASIKEKLMKIHLAEEKKKKYRRKCVLRYGYNLGLLQVDANKDSL